MRPFLSICAFLMAVLVAGCTRSVHVEERIIELPRHAPNATLSAASRIGQELIGANFFAAVRERFPSLTEAQFQGLFLSWNEGIMDGKQTVFFRTGVRYTGAMPDSKAVADDCASLVKAAVASAFPEAHSGG